MADEQTNEKKDIKEITDVLNAVKLLAVDTKKILADGKLDIKDLPVAMDLLNQLNDFVEAAKGIGEIPAEVKDLDAAEAEQIIAKVFEIISAVKAS